MAPVLNPRRSIALPYAAGFEACRADLPGRDLPWLVDGREAAMARFAELGLPSQKVEEWKYSNLSALAKTDFTEPDREAAEAAREEVARRFAKRDATRRLVFVNGMLDGPLSDLAALPAGVRVLSLAEAMAGQGDLLKAQLDALPAFNGHALAALNTAFMADGCLVILEPDAELALDLLFVAAPCTGAAAYHPRISIAAGKLSRLTISERHAALGDLEYWSNPVTAINLGEGARMGHYKLQEESRRAWQTSLTRARLAAGAAYENFTVATGARFARNEVEVVLAGARAVCELGGGFMLAGEQQVDNRLRVDHRAPECTSRQTYKGVLDDRAHGVFQGKTVVDRDAQKSDGNQLSRALLLSPDAVMDAKPELEIYADDVKCSHGATVGELDGEQLFYLRARGIDEATARGLLIAAFMADHLQSISDDRARDWLHGAVSEWLARHRLVGEG
ncbi:MAG TPA: Fe-S cluster assembly protein SufD [Alphaproteobacteria bacterium]|nr:Fe-S cluster assembly protein SufD [Alphaproteobacteria bacterium]